VFYFAVSYALHLNLSLSDLAVNRAAVVHRAAAAGVGNGFGVREATFSFYFTRVGQPLESALLISLVPQALIMICSLAGAAVFVSRTQRAPAPPDAAAMRAAAELWTGYADTITAGLRDMIVTDAGGALVPDARRPSRGGSR
jgi:hypothetical protein